MKKFNNDAYQSLVTDLIGDAFYSTSSIRGKLATIRSYAEVIIRKILDLNPNQKVTIGNSVILEKISNLPNHNFFENALSIMRPIGNDATHTEH